MTQISSCRFVAGAMLFFSGLATLLYGQTLPTKQPADAQETLKFVVVLSRHGVRSPTEEPAQYNIWSAAPWPQWSVPPGYLTAHGFQLMQQFGAYDRIQFAQQKLIDAKGCGDAGKVTFYADSDERTQETGKALAQGLFPGCDVRVRSLAQGVSDPLFHVDPSTITPEEQRMAAAAIAGRIGNKPSNLAESYQTQLIALDKVLANCGGPSTGEHKRISLLDIPSGLAPGKGDHLAELRGPLSTASTLTENLLLEYTEGMEDSNVGWGCVKGPDVRLFIDLHTAATDYAQRTVAIARPQASNLLAHILLSMQQAQTRRSVIGATSKPADRALFLVGHDTNLENISGVLNINWIADGRRDDTAPGSALVFELWMNPKDGAYSVRTYFTVQSLDQMRSASALTPDNPPARVPVFLPGCSREDFSCSWPEFEKTLQDAIDPRHVETR